MGRRTHNRAGQQLHWERRVTGGTGVPQEQEGTSHGGGQQKKTKMWGEDSSRKEGGTALTTWLELESRRHRAKKTQAVERQVSQFSTNQATHT